MGFNPEDDPEEFFRNLPESQKQLPPIFHDGDYSPSFYKDNPRLAMKRRAAVDCLKGWALMMAGKAIGLTAPPEKFGEAMVTIGNIIGPENVTPDAIDVYVDRLKIEIAEAEKNNPLALMSYSEVEMLTKTAELFGTTPEEFLKATEELGPPNEKTMEQMKERFAKPPEEVAEDFLATITEDLGIECATDKTEETRVRKLDDFPNKGDTDE